MITNSDDTNHDYDGCALFLLFSFGISGWIMGWLFYLMVIYAFNPLSKEDSLSDWIIYAQILFIPAAFQSTCLSFCVWLLLQINTSKNKSEILKTKARAILQSHIMWPFFLIIHQAFYFKWLAGV